jgi:hypothetical protein
MLSYGTYAIKSVENNMDFSWELCLISSLNKTAHNVTLLSLNSQLMKSTTVHEFLYYYSWPSLVLNDEWF